MAEMGFKRRDGSSAAPAVPASRLSAKIIALLLLINLLWGGSSLAAKVALHSIPPMTLAFARFSLAAVLMYLTATALKVNLRVARRDWGRFWAMGALGLALTYVLVYAGIRRTTATDSSLIIAAEPVFLAILSRVFLREPMPRAKVGGIAAGLAGVLLLVTDGRLPRAFSGMLAGDALIALGLIFEAGASIVGKGLVARYPTLSVMTYQMIVGSIALAPFAFSELATPTESGLVLPPAALLSLFYLVVPCTVFAFTAWFTLLDKRAPGELSVFLFLQPVVGAVLGAVFLHEKFTAFTVTGAALVLLALTLINRRPSAAPPPPPTA